MLRALAAVHSCQKPRLCKKSSFSWVARGERHQCKWTLSRVPFGRWGESHEVANLIIFLLSDKSSYINGEDINIDGGWLSS